MFIAGDSHPRQLTHARAEVEALLLPIEQFTYLVPSVPRPCLAEGAQARRNLHVQGDGASRSSRVDVFLADALTTTFALQTGSWEEVGISYPAGHTETTVSAPLG